MQKMQVLYRFWRYGKLADYQIFECKITAIKGEFLCMYLLSNFDIIIDLPFAMLGNYFTLSLISSPQEREVLQNPLPHSLSTGEGSFLEPSPSIPLRRRGRYFRTLSLIPSPQEREVF
jgi:hypothetical protein